MARTCFILCSLPHEDRVFWILGVFPWAFAATVATLWAIWDWWHPVVTHPESEASTKEKRND